MEKFSTLIIGGGAAGLFLATVLKKGSQKVAVLERGERVGRKLSATGNGQGNVSNLAAKGEHYFSFSRDGATRARKIVHEFDDRSLVAHLESLGLLLFADERDRIYPTSRQASSLTDVLRFSVSERGIELRTGVNVTAISKRKDGFEVTAESGEFFAENVVICTGGKAAKNFGSDGFGYGLAKKFGHSLTPLYPSLVQLKTETTHIKTLKGIKVSDALVTAKWQDGEKTLRGDILFTDYGVSGDSVFRLSAFVADKLEKGVSLSVDFLPEFSEERIYSALRRKRENFPQTPIGELLCGMVNNQIARAAMKRAENDLLKAAGFVKNFTLPVTGSLGFDYAQVTKGGIRLDEVDDDLQSKFVKGLYFAGEILDVDGACGGFNLQWAYSSACVVAKAIERRERR